MSTRSTTGNNNRYKFNTYKLNEVRVLNESEYSFRLVRVAATTYSRNSGKKFLVQIMEHGEIKITRFK